MTEGTDILLKAALVLPICPLTVNKLFCVKTLATLSASFAQCKREDVKYNVMWGKGGKISAKQFFQHAVIEGERKSVWGKVLLQLKMYIQKDWSPSL